MPGIVLCTLHIFSVHLYLLSYETDIISTNEGRNSSRGLS